MSCTRYRWKIERTWTRSGHHNAVDLIILFYFHLTHVHHRSSWWIHCGCTAAWSQHSISLRWRSIFCKPEVCLEVKPIYILFFSAVLRRARLSCKMWKATWREVENRRSLTADSRLAVCQSLKMFHLGCSMMALPQPAFKLHRGFVAEIGWVRLGGSVCAADSAWSWCCGSRMQKNMPKIDPLFKQLLLLLLLNIMLMTMVITVTWIKSCTAPSREHQFSSIFKRTPSFCFHQWHG